MYAMFFHGASLNRFNGPGLQHSQVKKVVVRTY
jgi:hypothetical protein